MGSGSAGWGTCMGTPSVQQPLRLAVGFPLAESAWRTECGSVARMRVRLAAYLLQNVGFRPGH
ncbi:MAG: hypothetical protein ACI8X5_000054 [Planctomycetota bacterium]|jgi:hypothetical protein